MPSPASHLTTAIPLSTDVDTPKAVTHVSLCAGYGGIDLGLKRAIPSLRTVAFSEIEAFACANLVSKMESGQLDPAPIWTDLKTFPYSEFRDRVDILSGGYPCQPFSAAGKRLGKDDPRHLWPFIADGIASMRPRVCFFENVEGHITLGLSDVIEDLAGLGYRTTWGIFSAAEVGAPHQRKRIFILAHRNIERLERWNCGILSERSIKLSSWPSRPSIQQHAWEPPRVVGNAEIREDDRREPGDLGQEKREGGCFNDAVDGAGQGVADTGFLWSDGRSDGSCRWIRESGEACVNATGSGSQGDGMRQAQPPLGRDPDGASGGVDYAQLCVSCDNRTDELRLLGNGVVPATAHKAFVTLLHELT